jgi:hypothetical protein
MRIFLYKVVSQPHEFDFAGALRHIHSREVDERNRSRNLDHIRLEALREERGLMFADFLKIRMHHGPAKAGLDSPVEGFDLESDEGFGEETAIVYDPSTKHVVVQYNHHGPWPVAISEYIGLFVHTNPANIEFAPKLDAAVHAKIRGATIVKKLILGIAPKKLTDDDYEQATSLGAGIRHISQRTDAEKIEIVISASRSRSSGLDINLPILSRWINRFRGAGKDSPVLTARATATNSEENPAEVLDLLLHRLTAEATLQPGPDKRYSRNDRWNALERAFNSWRPLIHEPNH